MRVNRRGSSEPVLVASGLLWCLLILTLPPELRAQTISGSILGAVTDSSGARVPGALISVVKVARGVTTPTKTDASGYYEVPNLEPGTYNVSAEQQGFKKKEVTGIVLRLEQKARVDIVLEIGAVTEQVTVSGMAPLLATETSERAQIIENKTIVQLPLNGRNFTQLAKLGAGVIEAPPGDLFNRPNVSIGGARPEYNQFLVDGVNSQENFFRRVLLVPSVDAIQEFNVKQNNYSAEFGNAIGGIINVALRSGTNEFHGNLYEFLRNDKLDAKNFFAPSKEAFRFNQFGGTFGGPVVLPKLYNGRNRTFFFFNYEGGRFRRPFRSFGRVPTEAERSGNFAGAAIYDPLTLDTSTGAKQRFANDRVPSDRFNTISEKFLPFWPSSSMPLNARNQNYFYSSSLRNDTDQSNIRIDHQFNQKISLFGSLSIADSTSFTPGPFPRYFGRSESLISRRLTLGYIHVLSPSVVNDLRVGYTRGRIPEEPENNDRNWHSALGFTAAEVFNDPKRFGFPGASVAGFTGLGNPSLPNLFVTNNYHLSDNLSLRRGSHSLRFGGQIVQKRDVIDFCFSCQTDQSFGGAFSAARGQAPTPAHAFADFLLGFPTSRTQVAVVPEIGRDAMRLRKNDFAVYLQDDWRISSRLVLNLGLRYEINQPPKEESYRTNLGIDLARGRIYYAKKLRIPDNLLPPIGFADRVDRERILFGDFNDFASRVGFALRPWIKSRTVLRAAYGITYAQPLADLFTESGISAPFAIQATESADITGRPPFVMGQFGSGFFNPNVLLGYRSLDPHLVDGYVQHWTFNIQQELPASVLLDLAYTGSKGTHLDRFLRLNVPEPGPGPIQPRRPYPHLNESRLAEATGNSSYQAMQVKVEKQYARGLMLLGAYTLGKSIDHQSSTSSGAGSGDPGIQWIHFNNKGISKARSSFDVRHRFSMSWVYDLPLGRDLKGGLGHVIGGWQVNGILTFQSGFPFTPRIGTSLTNTGIGTPPIRLRDGSLPTPQRSVDRWFDAAAFAAPPPLTFGNSGRNIIDGPGLERLDMSLVKEFKISEFKRVEFRSEFFNVPNHAHFGFPQQLVDRPGVGTITSTAGDNRDIQFGLKFWF